MKRILMLLLALALPLWCAGTALAVEEDADVFFPQISVNTVHQAGKTYTYPLTNSQGSALGVDAYDQYGFEVNICSGEEWIDTLEVQPGADGGPVLTVTPSDAGGGALGVGRVRYRVTCRSLETGLTIKSSLERLTVRVDGEDVEGEEILLTALEIPAANASFDREPFVSPSQSLVTFAQDLEEAEISFDDLASFRVQLGEKRCFRLYFEQQIPQSALLAAEEAGARTEGLCFPGRPVFQYTGELRITTRMPYLYEVEENGSLQLMEAVRDGEELVVSTSHLGSYVASSLPLT